MLRIETSAYNSNRYGKPWIAKVTLNSSRNDVKFLFGNWVGQSGEAGLLLLEIAAGEFFAKGQKDFRKYKNSTPRYYKFITDTTYIEVSKVDVFKELFGKL